MTTHLDANAVFALYLPAIIVVVAPAGIAVNKTETPVISEDNENKIQNPYTIRGRMPRRIKARYRTDLSARSLSFTPVRVMPITNIDMGVVHTPSWFSVVMTGFGNVI